MSHDLQVLENIEETVKSIKELLTGNRLNPADKGMIGEVHRINEKVNKALVRIERLENFKRKLIWIGVGIGLGAGYPIGKFFEFLFTKH